MSWHIRARLPNASLRWSDQRTCPRCPVRTPTVWRAPRRHRRSWRVEIPVRVSRRARKLSHPRRRAAQRRDRRPAANDAGARSTRSCFEHRAWLERQLAEAAEGLPPRPATRTTSSGSAASRSPAPRVPSLLETWYREQARDEVERTVEREAARLGVDVHARDDPRPADALGLVLEGRRAVVQLAADRRAAGGPRRTSSSTSSVTCVHHDHSPEFWRLVAARAARPTREERAWLSEHGPELLAYRVPKRRAA